MSADLRQYEVWASTKAHARRVDKARQIMQKASERGRVVVSVSWGKDSVAMAHLALETLGRVPLFYMVSRTALPGWEPVQAWFQERADVHLLPPSRTMDQTIALLHEIGLPHERKPSTQQRVVQKQKAIPGRTWAIQHGFAVQFLGMRMAEGGPRARLIKARGPTYTHSDGITICCPLAYWSNKDVWAYIAANDVPYNRRIYDAETHGYTRETLRNGGYLYTDGAQDGWCVWLRKHFPEQWRMLADEFPRVRQYS